MTPAMRSGVGSDEGTIRPTKLSSIIWHITDVCPLKCPYCFSTKTSEAVSCMEAELVAKVLRELGTRKIDVAGGEPLTHPELPRLCQTLWDFGFSLTITTSSRGRNANRQWLTKRCNDFESVIVSIDGPEALHDSLRGSRGSYARAFSLIDELIRCGAHVRVNTVLTRRLVDDSSGLRLLSSVIEGSNVSEWILIEPHPANSKPSFHSHEVDHNEYLKAVEAIRSHLAKSRIAVGQRERSRYSGYHLIYPDGYLRQHTEGPVDTSGVLMRRNNIPAIKAYIETMLIRE
jgi:molybdenum cofactor biosynthesis enzyme MoaA